MKRWKKAAIPLAILLGTFVYNEFIVYYLILYQCSWPGMAGKPEAPVKAMFLSDPHLLGPTGHWWDRLRRWVQCYVVF